VTARTGAVSFQHDLVGSDHVPLEVPRGFPAPVVHGKATRPHRQPVEAGLDDAQARCVARSVGE